MKDGSQFYILYCIDLPYALNVEHKLTLYPGGNMVSSSSSPSGRFLSSISRCHVYACSCSGVMDTKWPGVGVTMAMALFPVGVTPLGVMPDGVMPLGVIPPVGVIPVGVIPPGVMFDGVMPLGVKVGVMPPGVAFPGVSSHLDRRLLAPGVGVS